MTRHLEANLKRQLVKDFKRTNQLNDKEGKEWSELFERAKKGNKDDKQYIKEGWYAKEVHSLKYVPAVWFPGDEPT